MDSGLYCNPFEQKSSDCMASTMKAMADTLDFLLKHEVRCDIPLRSGKKRVDI